MAIGLEAFNKFAQEERDKLERERTTEEEEEKKRKITGRFLIKGMVADTFALIKNFCNSNKHCLSY